MQARAEKERAKYEAIWASQRYHEFSPGARFSSTFSGIVEDKKVSIIDLGCGAGEGGKALKELGFTTMTFMDIVKVDKDLHPFICGCLWDKWGLGLKWEWGFCCDVMEHIPPEYVSLVLHRIRERTKRVFFSIAFVDDTCGEIIQEKLHLTIRSFKWWRDFLKEFGEVEDARDLGIQGIFVVNFG